MEDETNNEISLENSSIQSNSFEYIQPDSQNSDQDQTQSDDDDEEQPTDDSHLLKQQSNQVNGQDQSPQVEETPTNEINHQNQFNFEEQLLQIDNQDDQQQFKAQREIDEDEIPPAELPTEQQTESRSSSRNSPTLLNDDNRPLTKLEDPFGNHQEEQEEQEEEFSSIENPTNNSSTNEHLLTDENPLENPTLLSFLPDVVIETTTNENNIKIETNLLNENSNEINPQDFTEEDFPPLPKSELPVHEIINDQDFPPLNSSPLVNEQQSTELEPPIDILKNKSLLKQTLIKGEPNTRPSRSTIVTISYSLSLIDSLTSNTRLIEQISHEEYFVGERDLIPAIDVALLLMDRGEKALVESDVRHCYGEQGCEEKTIPSVTTLNPYKMLIEIELHNWRKAIDIQLLSIEQRIFWSDKKRLNGNFHYRRQDYKTSLECYQGASRYLDLELNPIDQSIDQNQINILIEKYIQVQNNVAQVYLLAKNYEDCLNAVTNVLKFDSKNVKALFRQGKALFELGKYQEAIQSLKIFLQIQKANSNSSPNIDSDKANEMILISENKLANYQKNEKEIYQRMFRPSTTNNQSSTQIQTKKQTVDSNTNWLPYIALGAAAVAVIGYITFTKYRKLS